MNVCRVARGSPLPGARVCGRTVKASAIYRPKIFDNLGEKRTIQTTRRSCNDHSRINLSNFSFANGSRSRSLWITATQSRSGSTRRRPQCTFAKGTAASYTTSSWHASPPSPPTVDPTKSVTLPEQLRSVMRLLTHSVVVCTSTQDATPRGMTMSSFTSLTLSPTPLITFNVAVPSRTLDAIADSKHFNIHILAGDGSGAAVADHFTRGNANDHIFDGVEGVSHRKTSTSKDTAPVLEGNGVMHVLRCKLLDDAPSGGVVRVRDHAIVVGEVLELIPGKHDSENFGLAYADRKYRLVGGVLCKDN